MEYRGLCISEILWTHDPHRIRESGVPNDEYENDGLELGRWILGCESLEDIEAMVYGLLLGKWGIRPDRKRVRLVARDVMVMDRLTLGDPCGPRHYRLP